MYNELQYFKKDKSLFSKYIGDFKCLQIYFLTKCSQCKNNLQILTIISLQFLQERDFYMKCYLTGVHIQTFDGMLKGGVPRVKDHNLLGTGRKRSFLWFSKKSRLTGNCQGNSILKIFHLI